MKNKFAEKEEEEEEEIKKGEERKG
ncbi:hypothetical protein TRV_05952 [Trichophyton verrucosum HKI 0517]|uniref:Uncharacterized protein n=1 Tax=Trichophyton verrucosum (strain HKI 0517) TaxID=663202 RepID=D4DFK1_TRIVH|nr:hypothetical protein TRV_05952 [Trichophyton verrucosum HKI 0517]